MFTSTRIRDILHSNTLRKNIFTRIIFPSPCVHHENALFPLNQFPPLRISESRLVAGIPAAINTPSTWHARQSGAEPSPLPPPPLIPALKPVLLDSYAPYPNSRTRPQPPARLSAEGWRVAMGSSQIWRKSDIELLFFECSSIDRKDRGKCEKMVEFKLRLRLKNDFDRKNELSSYDNYENSKIHSIPLSSTLLLFTRRVEIRIHYVKISFPFFPRYSSRSPIVRHTLDPIAGERGPARTHEWGRGVCRA